MEKEIVVGDKGDSNSEKEFFVCDKNANSLNCPDNNTLSVEECVKNLIETDENLIEMLTLLSGRAARHGDRSKWAKVAGNATTAVGIAGQIGGLVLAPFTAGASLWINVAATGVMVAGTMTNVSVNIADVFKSKAYVKKLEFLLVQHDEAAAKFRKVVENIRYVVDALKKKGLSEEDAILLTLKHIKDGSLKIVYNITAFSITAQMVNQSIAAGLLAADGAVVGGQGLAQTFAIGKTAVEGITKAEVLTFANLVKDPAMLTSGTMSAAQVTTTVLSSAIGVAGVALSAAITIWEVKNLVRDWKKNHPTADIIDDVIDKLRKEKEALEILCLPKSDGEKGAIKSSSIYPSLPKDESDSSINSLKHDDS